MQSLIMITEATDNLEHGISVGGYIINAIRYADDTAVAANSQKGLQQQITSKGHQRVWYED